MAGVTTALMAAGMAANAIQIADAQKKKQESEFEAKNQAAKLSQVQETDYMAAMQVPTLAYDLASQAAMARSAEAINALQGAGTEAVLGGVPSVVQEGMQQDLQIAGALGEAQYQNELMKAQAKQGIESRRVAREQDIAESRLQGAQLGAFSATQNRNQAIGGMINLAAQGAAMYDANQDLYKAPAQAGQAGAAIGGKIAADTNQMGNIGSSIAGSAAVPQPTMQPYKNPFSAPSFDAYLESAYGLPAGTFSSFKPQ